MLLANDWKSDWSEKTTAGAPPQFGLLAQHHLGADRDAVVEVGDVNIDQAEAARRNFGADRVRPIGAVDAVHRAPEIHRARAERVAGATGHEARQIGLAGDHLG